MPASKDRIVAVLALATTLSFLVAGCGSGTPAEPSPMLTDSLATVTTQDAGVGGLRLGAQLYSANCQACHGDQEGRGGISEAPTHNETGHTWHHPDVQLKDWVLNGKFPGAMPALKDKLTEEEVDAILAYIKTWWTPDQRESQADISRTYQVALDKQNQGQ